MTPEIQALVTRTTSVLTRLREYDPDVSSASVIGEAAAMIRELRAALVQQAQETKDLDDRWNDIPAVIARLRESVDQGGFDGRESRDSHTADRLEALFFAVGTERSMYLAWRKRAEEAEAQLARVTTERDDLQRKWEPAKHSLGAAWKERAEQAEAQLARVTAERDKACSLLKTTGGGYIPLDAVAIALQRDEAKAALSAHREAIEETAAWDIYVKSEDVKHFVADVLSRLAALASPRQVEQEHDDTCARGQMGRGAR